MSPGDRMPTEKELAARLGASRTVVREAIKILSATGRVSAQKGRGLYVADGEGVPAPPSSAGSSCRPTWTISSCSSSSVGYRRSQPAAWPRPRPPAELRAIEAAVQDCSARSPDRRPGAVRAGDDEFHLGVAAASHNSLPP